jgi:hypothetical protein
MTSMPFSLLTMNYLHTCVCCETRSTSTCTSILVFACLNPFIYHALQPLTGIPPFRLKENHQHGGKILCFCRPECPYIQTFTSTCHIFQASFHIVFCQASLGNMAEENADPATTVRVLTQSQNLIFFHILTTQF